MPKIENLPQATSAADANVAVILQARVTKKVPLSILKTYFSGSAIQNEFDGDAPPGTDDDAAHGYSVGSVWIDRTSSPMEAYRCVNATEGAAIWLNTTLELGDLDGAFAGKVDKVETDPDPSGLVATFDEYGNLAKSETPINQIVTSTDISAIVKLTQAEYDALDPGPDENTLYVTVEEEA